MTIVDCIHKFYAQTTIQAVVSFMFTKAKKFKKTQSVHVTGQKGVLYFIAILFGFISNYTGQKQRDTYIKRFSALEDLSLIHI